MAASGVDNSVPRLVDAAMASAALAVLMSARMRTDPAVTVTVMSATGTPAAMASARATYSFIAAVKAETSPAASISTRTACAWTRVAPGGAGVGEGASG